jgi:branched-chain amino acid transport system permease protein
MFFQQLISGLAIGSIYGIVALGFTLIWNAARVVNFAQGEFSMVGGFLAYTFFVLLGIPYYGAFLFALLIAGAIGWIMDFLVIRPLRSADPLTVVITTLGVSIILANGAMFIWGTKAMAFPSVFGSNPVQLGKVMVIPENLWIIGFTVCLVAFFYVFFQKTKAGKAIRSVAQDKETASLMGINVNLMIGMTFAVAGALGAAAGVLLAPLFFVSTDIGLTLVLKAFIAAVLGGFGSLQGALLGGIILGVLETMGAFYISSTYKDVITFTVLIFLLIFSPTGLFKKPG